MKRLMAMVLWVLIGFLMPSMAFASTSFVQKAELTDSVPQTFSFPYFVSVSADGTTVAVAAPFQGNGAVYVYGRTGPTWTSMTQVAKLTASDGAEFDGLGESVKVSADGSTIVAGADAVGGYQGAD